MMTQNKFKKIAAWSGLMAAACIAIFSGACFADVESGSSVDVVNVSVDTICTLSRTSGTGSYVATIASGTSNSNIGSSIFSISCNDGEGWRLMAKGWDANAGADSTYLTNTSDSSLKIATSTATSGTDSAWAMKLGTSATNVEFDNGFSNNTFHTVPSEDSRIVYNEGTTTGTTLTTTYQAYISPNQPAGVYKGGVKYTLSHPSVPAVNVNLTFDANGGTFAGGSATNVLTYSAPEVVHYTEDTKTTSTTDTVDASGNHKTSVDDPMQYADNANYYQDLTLETDAPGPYNLTIYYATEVYDNDEWYDWICVFDGTSYEPGIQDDCSDSTAIAPSTNIGDGYTDGNRIGGPNIDYEEYAATATFKVNSKTARIYFTSDDYDGYHSYGFWAEFKGGGDVVTQNLLSGTYIDKPSDRTGYIFLGWATTPNATAPDYTYDPNALVMENTAVYAVWKNCNVIGTSIASIAYMQQFDYMCMASSMTTGTAYTLKDNRDSTTYHVSKLADGNIWMLDNLALGGDAPIALTSADTNIATDWTLPASGTTCFSDASCTNGGLSGTGYTVPAINSSLKTTEQPASGSFPAGKVGVYYNYCAASAGTYCGDAAPVENATHDICPKGWRMPTGGSSGEYQALYTAYDYQSALSTPLSGYFRNGSAINRGLDGYFWSSTRYNGYSMYTLYVGSSRVNPASHLGRDSGSSMRCVVSK